MNPTFNINDKVSIIDESGCHRAKGKLGMTGVITATEVVPYFNALLLTVSLKDGTQVEMFHHRFELFVPKPKKPRKVKAKAPGTKIAKLRAHFLSGKSLTQLEAIGLYGAFRLAARVHDLKADGMKIVTRMKEDPNGNPYAEYQLRSPWVKG